MFVLTVVNPVFRSRFVSRQHVQRLPTTAFRHVRPNSLQLKNNPGKRDRTDFWQPHPNNGIVWIGCDEGKKKAIRLHSHADTKKRKFPASSKVSWHQTIQIILQTNDNGGGSKWPVVLLPVEQFFSVLSIGKHKQLTKGEQPRMWVTTLRSSGPLHHPIPSGISTLVTVNPLPLPCVTFPAVRPTTPQRPNAQQGSRVWLCAQVNKRLEATPATHAQQGLFLL